MAIERETIVYDGPGRPFKGKAVPDGDRRSWQAMTDFLAELFG